MTEVKKRRRLVQWHTAAITDFVSNIKSARSFVNERLNGVPYNIGRFLLDEYTKRYESETALNPTRSANIYLRKSTDEIRAYLEKCPLDLAALFNEMRLEELAKEAALHCYNTMMNFARDEATEDYYTNLSAVYEKLCAFARSYGVNPPLSRCETEVQHKEAVIVRLTREEWWEKKFKRIRDQVNEHVYILAGFVRKGRQAYASNMCVREWEQQRASNAAYLAAMELVNEDTNERFNLADIAEATTANPEKRRIELMVRCRGLEELADELGYISYFVTWTAPSKYHPNSRKYNGAQPNETQAYLCNQWAKARAKIKRQEIEWFGVRVAEPHADACPHWHMLIFVRPEDKQAMQSILADYATKEDKSELVNKAGKLDIRARFDIEEIDRSKGSATGYIAKYISKNISADNANAENLDQQPDFETGNSDLNSGIKRVVAWASRWRIRQFQFFGAESVSIWRECRRLKEAHEVEAFERIRSAADHAKWSEFTKLIKENPVSLAYEETKNEFGELGRKIIGLFFAETEIGTREGNYRIEKREAQNKNDDSRFTWSPVNNCTGFNDSLKRAVQNAGLPASLYKPLASGHGVIDGDRGFKVVNNELRMI